MRSSSPRIAASALVLAAFAGAGCSGDVSRFAYMGEQPSGSFSPAPIPTANAGFASAPQTFAAPVAQAPTTPAPVYAPPPVNAPVQMAANRNGLLPPPPAPPIAAAPAVTAPPPQTLAAPAQLAASTPITAPAPQAQPAPQAPAPVQTTLRQPLPNPPSRPAAPAPQPPSPQAVAPAVPAAPAPAAPVEDRVASVPTQPTDRAAGTQTTEADPAKFRWPVRGRVISQFGSKPDGQRNDGINLVVPEGTPVKAAKDGEVIYSGDELEGYGKLVLVRHTGNWVTAYAHNSALEVRRGDKVRRGQVVAKAGRTGNVTFPQVHFEIRRGSTPVNPMKHLEG